MQKIFNVYREAYSGIPRDIWLLSLIMLINRAGSMVMIFFVLYLTNVFGFSNQTAGAIISLSAFGGILGGLAGGWCSDRFGSIKAQVLFLVMVSLQFIVMLFARNVIEIGAALFVLMFLNEAVRPGLHAACLDYCQPENQKRSMGLLRLTINLGMAIGPVAGGFLAEYGLWNWLFIVNAITCLVSAALLLMVFGWGIQGNHALKLSAKKSPDLPASPWRDRKMLIFGFFYLLMLIVFIQLASTFIKYLEDVYGLSESQIGLISAINPLLIVLGEMVIIKTVEKCSNLKTIAVGSLLICLGFGLLPFGHSIAFCVFTVMVWTLGEIFAFPIASVYVADLSNQANRGRYMGFITVLFSISMIIGPAIGLWLYEIDRNLPWYLSLVIGLVTFASFWRMAANPVKGQGVGNSSRNEG